MFKQAYVRGVQNALIQGGHVVFADDDSATKVADYVANRLNFDPVNNAVPREVTVKVATAIIEASAYLQKQAGFKAASYTKVASVDDLSKLAHAHTLDVMQKAAEGSNYEGGDKGNKEPESAEGKMDTSLRPPEYATNSLGKTEVDTAGAEVGKEIVPPHEPKRHPEGTNSVIEQSRTASLGALINKLAEGSNYVGGDKGNKVPESAEGRMERNLRPPGYAVLPSQGALGELMELVKGPAIVGREIPQPMQPGQQASGVSSNSLTQQSAKAASENHYVSLFKSTASEVSPYLPGGMHEDVKIAHVRACMGMTTEEKAHYLTGLQKEAADNTSGSQGTRHEYTAHTSDATHSRPGAYDGRKSNQVNKQAEMPAFIQDKIDAKKDGGDDKKEDDEKNRGGAFPGAAPPFGKKDDDKKDDDDKNHDGKKDDDKKDDKEASLRDHFRRINNTIQPLA